MNMDSAELQSDRKFRHSTLHAPSILINITNPTLRLYQQGASTQVLLMILADFLCAGGTRKDNLVLELSLMSIRPIMLLESLTK